TLTDLAAGRHAVVLEGPSGTIQRTVTVVAGETATVDESLFSGWVAVFSPFEVVVTENGRVFRPDERNQFMMPSGPHDLRISNRALGYEETRHVDLKPGDTTTLSLAPPRSTIAITASDAAEVWLDGAHVGDTPMRDLSADLGTHEVVLRRAAG